ncbi:hypothetical protein FBU30_003297, partial [Linnemannia zychae]
TAATTFTPKPNTGNPLPNTPPNTLSAKKSQQHDVEGFTKVTRKRTGKKRIRLSKDSNSMEGIESTSIATPSTLTESIQQAVIPVQQVIAPTQHCDAREEPTQTDPTDTAPLQQDEGEVYTTPNLDGTESITSQSAQVELHPSNRITHTIVGITNLIMGSYRQPPDLIDESESDDNSTPPRSHSSASTHRQSGRLLRQRQDINYNLAEMSRNS